MTALPVRSPEWIDQAPIRVEEAVHIAATPQCVWSFIEQHEGWPQWFQALSSVEVTTGASGVGGGRRVRIGRIAIDEQFTAWDPAEHFAFAVVRSDVPILASMAESVRLIPEADGCRVVYRQGYQGRTGAGWLVRLASRRSRRELRRALDELRNRAEAAGDTA
jgi:uncharacterized protein YndB with AHSA1/START domain